MGYTTGREPKTSPAKTRRSREAADAEAPAPAARPAPAADREPVATSDDDGLMNEARASVSLHFNLPST